MTAEVAKVHAVESISQSVSDENLALAQRATQAVIMTLNEQIDQIERAVLR